METIMANTIQTYVGDGTSTIYTFNFDYIRQSFIKVLVDGAEVPYTLTGTYQVTLNVAPAEGNVIIIQRQTDTEKLVDFVDGSILVAKDLNLSALQALHIAAEANDKAAGSLLIDQTGAYTAGFRRVADLGDPVENRDAVTKVWTETAMTSQLAQATAEKNAAVTARVAAEAARDAASASQSAAASSAAAAASSASGAATSASNAATSATAASTSAGQSAATASYSEDRALAAGASASAASASASSAAASASSAAADAATLGNLASVGISASEINKGAQYLDNKIINGSFDWWQRGTSFTGVMYGADRWINGAEGGTVTQSRQAFNVDASFGQNKPAFRLRQVVSGQSLASHHAITRQRIENVRSYNGTTITVLGFARRDSGSGNLAFDMEQGFGTGGSPSGFVTGIGAQQISLSANWEPFAVTAVIPSLAGKTLGTNNDHYLGINFWASAGANFNDRTASLGIQNIGVELWGIHIRVGTFDASAAWNYVQPPLEEELRRCQRYFCQTNATARFWAGAGNQFVDVQVYWPTTMRSTPNVSRSGGFVNTATPFLNNAGTAGCRFGLQSLAAGDTYALVNTISADAEL